MMTLAVHVMPWSTVSDDRDVIQFLACLFRFAFLPLAIDIFSVTFWSAMISSFAAGHASKWSKCVGRLNRRYLLEYWCKTACVRVCSVQASNARQRAKCSLPAAAACAPPSWDQVWYKHPVQGPLDAVYTAVTIAAFWWLRRATAAPTWWNNISAFLIYFFNRIIQGRCQSSLEAFSPPLLFVFGAIAK